MAPLIFKVTGMSCAGCARSIERALAQQRPAVISAHVNLALEQLAVVLAPGLLPQEEQRILEQQIRVPLANMGFQITPLQTQGEMPKSSDKSLSVKVMIAASLSFLVMLLSMVLMHWPSALLNGLLQLLLTAPLFFGIGLEFQKALWRFLRTGHANMNTLVGMGTFVAFVYSCIVLALAIYREQTHVDHLYFEAVAVIIFAVYLGKFFESKAKKKSIESLTELLNLASKEATVLVDELSHKEERRPLSAIVVGDRLLARPGEKIAVDGVVENGKSYVDESMMSGEAMPVAKSCGDHVLAGTINGLAPLIYRATKVGPQTLLAQIIAGVEQAQQRKAPIERYADRVSALFVPTVLVIAAMVFLLWLLWGPAPSLHPALTTMIAVLVVACPCALGLATPTAVVVATGRASQRGILIGGGDVIEKAATIDTICFDKTGTLTKGHPQVISWTPTKTGPVLEEDQWLRAVRAIESFSEHPLAQAIVQFSQAENGNLVEETLKAQIRDFEVVVGQGVQARVGQDLFRIGRIGFMSERPIPLEMAAGATAVWVEKNGQLLGHFLIADQLRAEAKLTVAKFQQQGITCWLLSGDQMATVRHVAKELGIEHFMAEMLPAQKMAQIEFLQSQGHRVAMVGDGINDAGALAKSDLSLAMGSGTDVAISVADVNLLHGDLHKAYETIDLAKATLRVIRQNLFFSFIYNILCIPVAAGVLTLFGGPLFDPMFAAFAMGISSLSVVTNSLRLRWRLG